MFLSVGNRDENSILISQPATMTFCTASVFQRFKVNSSLRKQMQARKLRTATPCSFCSRVLVSATAAHWADCWCTPCCGEECVDSLGYIFKKATWKEFIQRREGGSVALLFDSINSSSRQVVEGRVRECTLMSFSHKLESSAFRLLMHGW